MNQSNDGTPSNDGATADAIREQVAQAYTAAIEHRTGPERAPCCGPSDEAKGEAKAAQANACCAGPSYTIDQLDGVSETVAGASFGCGNPVAFADVSDGSVVLDLGSGAGLDLLLAAERVGDAGRVIGVDMTDAMLETARRNLDASPIGQRVELRKGVIEALPVEDASVDHVISNCVINLSPDKPKVFREIWRVLKDHGRTVIADIVADREVPPKMRADGQLWGECISGALTEEAFLAALERAGFYGVSIVQKTFWREVEGCRFYSVTARGYKFEKQAGCAYVGQYAIYLGPLKAVIDEEGHLFPRGSHVEVCTDTAAKLSRAPYAGSFVTVDGPTGQTPVDGADVNTTNDAAGEAAACCSPESGCC